MIQRNEGKDKSKRDSDSSCLPVEPSHPKWFSGFGKTSNSPSQAITGGGSGVGASEKALVLEQKPFYDWTLLLFVLNLNNK